MELSLILKRVWRGRRILRYILHSVFFNFHYLPFHEAVKLPILLYKPKLLKLKGTIKIKQEDKIGFGMIRLGFPEVSLYPNTGIVFENYGGTVVFKGQCCIGNNSYLSIGPKAIVEICIHDQSIPTKSYTISNDYFIIRSQPKRSGS